MATLTISNSGGPLSVSTTYVENAAPTSADMIVATPTSGDATIDANISCRGFNLTGYAATLTHNAGFALNIGDATAADSNIAFKLPAGMTYNKLHPATCAINLQSTSATQQQVEFGGKIMGNVTFKGAGSSYIFNDDLECTKYYATMDIQQGTVNTNDKTITCMVFTETTTAAKTITLGASVINCYPSISECFHWGNTTGLTITANTATVNIYRSQTNPNGSSFIRIPSGKSNYLTINVYGGGIQTMATAGATAICKRVRFYGAAPLFGIADRVQLNATLAVTDGVEIYGYSADRRIRVHNGGDFVLPNTTSLYCEYTDFQSVNIATYTQDLSAMIGGAGDLGGNTGIIFTPAIDLYWKQTTPGTRLWVDETNWFLATNGGGGQGRVPLAQDSVFFDANSFDTAGCIVRCTGTSGVGFLSKNIDWTGSGYRAPTWNLMVDCTMYGSLTMETGCQVTSYGDAFLTFASNDAAQNFALTSAGINWPLTGLIVNLASTNNFTFVDDFTGNGLDTTLLQVSGGTIDFNDNDITVARLNLAGSSSVHKLGSGLIKLTGSGSVFSRSAGTIFATTGTIEISGNTTTAKTIAGGGQTYNNLILSGNINDTITFTGNNTWNNFDNQKTVAHTLLFTAGSTNTFLGTVTKSTGSLWTLSSTTTSIFTWSKASGTVLYDDAIISKSTASGGATFTANGSSINGGGNTGWSGFVANPFMWVGTTTDASLGSNWLGGVQPGVNDVAVFSGLYNANCSIIDSAGTINTWKGMILTLGYTGTVTLNNATASYGSEGIEVNAGVLTFTTRTINNAGKFRMTGGTFNAPAVWNQDAQGSVINTVFVSGGTYAHNSGSFILTGAIDAILTNTSARQFFNLSTSSFTGKLSGTFFADGSMTLQSQEFNGDASCRLAITAGSLTGTGLIRIVGTTMTLNVVEVPNLHFNCTGIVTLSADCIVNGTLTLTAVPTCNGNTIRCKANTTSAVTTISGTTVTSIEGTLPEQSMLGVGVLIGDVTINKTAGLVKLAANSQPCNIGKNFTVSQGQFNTNNFNIVLMNNVTVIESTRGIFYHTANSIVQINGTLTGRKILRQKLYANGIRL